MLVFLFVLFLFSKIILIFGIFCTVSIVTLATLCYCFLFDYLFLSFFSLYCVNYMFLSLYTSFFPFILSFWLYYSFFFKLLFFLLIHLFYSQYSCVGFQYVPLHKGQTVHSRYKSYRCSRLAFIGWFKVFWINLIWHTL